MEIAIQILRESKKLNTTVNNASSKVSSKAYVGWLDYREKVKQTYKSVSGHRTSD